MGCLCAKAVVASMRKARLAVFSTRSDVLFVIIGVIKTAAKAAKAVFFSARRLVRNKQVTVFAKTFSSLTSAHSPLVGATIDGVVLFIVSVPCRYDLLLL